MSKKKKKFDSSGKEVEGGAEMDMTPMIDITFQLIVFFLVANDLTRKEVEDVELPQAIYGQEDKGSEKDERVIINILPPDNPDAPPRLPDVRVKGKKRTLDELKVFMQSRADTKREEDGASAIYVLVRADRRTPWQHVQYVMQVCADPNIQIYKMQFASTKREDGKASSAADGG